MEVRHIMSKVMVTISPGTSLLEARRLMREKHVKRALVVDAKGRLVGVLDRRDIRERYIVHLLSHPAAQHKTVCVESLGEDVDQVLSQMTVEDAMASSPLTVRADASVETAALLMQKTHLYGLPVLDDGRLVGMLNERAVFGALVRIVSALRQQSPGMLEQVMDSAPA